MKYIDKIEYSHFYLQIVTHKFDADGFRTKMFKMKLGLKTTSKEQVYGSMPWNKVVAYFRTDAIPKNVSFMI
jgi:hypothetical protein